jgi:antitoxin component of RelBE/YafQ-DinJ toxin-antitoxin module
MLRTGLLQVRVNDTERAAIKAVAQQFQRDESTTVRLVFQKLAEELGVSAPQTNDQKTEASGQLKAA